MARYGELLMVTPKLTHYCWFLPPPPCLFQPQSLLSFMFFGGLCFTIIHTCETSEEEGRSEKRDQCIHGVRCFMLLVGFDQWYKA